MQGLTEIHEVYRWKHDRTAKCMSQPDRHLLPIAQPELSPAVTLEAEYIEVIRERDSLQQQLDSVFMRLRDAEHNNHMARELIVLQGNRIQALEDEITGTQVRPSNGSNRLQETERETVLAVLEQHNGNRTHAAKALGISIRTLRNKLREYRNNGWRDERDPEGHERRLGRHTERAQRPPATV